MADILENIEKISASVLLTLCNSWQMRLKMKNGTEKYYINRPRPTYGHKYTKYKMSHYNDGLMY